MPNDKDIQGKGEKSANRDPLSGEKGAHPIGTGVGAAAAGAAAGAAGGALAGPAGAAVGAVIGAVAGGLAGKGVAESIDPTIETDYWRENYESRPYYEKGRTFEEYEPAYRYGWESHTKYGDRSFDDVETDLARNWERYRGHSKMSWVKARHATRDAWDRLRVSMVRKAEVRASGDAWNRLGAPGVGKMEPRESMYESERRNAFEFVDPSDPSALETRPVPVRIYLSDPTLEQVSDIVRAVNAICGEAGLYLDFRLPEEWGSWFQRFIFRAQQLQTHPQTLQKLSRAKRALEIKHLDGPQAALDLSRMNGIAALLNSIGDNEMIAQIGSIVIIRSMKLDGKSRVMVRTLSQDQLLRLEQNPRLLREPEALIEALDEGTVGVAAVEHDAGSSEI